MKDLILKVLIVTAVGAVYSVGVIDGWERHKKSLKTARRKARKIRRLYLEDLSRAQTKTKLRNHDSEFNRIKAEMALIRESIRRLDDNGVAKKFAEELTRITERRASQSDLS